MPCNSPRVDFTTIHMSILQSVSIRVVSNSGLSEQGILVPMRPVSGECGEAWAKVELCVLPISRIAEPFTPTIALGALSEGVRRNGGETQVHPVREMGPVWGPSRAFLQGPG